MKKPVIFIHGFKGSRLVTGSGRCDWLTGAIALGLRTPRLSLPLEVVDERQARDERTATAPLDKVSVIPRVIEERVYAPFLEALRNSGRPWRAFAYDWRRDNAESAGRFKTFVEAVRDELGCGAVDIVAHSMGGLVALAALHSGLKGVERMLFAGSPLRGGIGFLDDMHAGTRTGFNGAVLAPPVLATFPSVYTFFPLRDANLLDADGRRLAIDLFAADSWRENKLGIFQDRFTPPPAFAAFLPPVLSAAQEFRRHLERTLNHYPHIDVLTGNTQPTLFSLRRTGAPGAWEWDVRGAGKELGDGRVCAAHALPPEGIPHVAHPSALPHGDLLNDPFLATFLQG